MLRGAAQLCHRFGTALLPLLYTLPVRSLPFFHTLYLFVRFLEPHGHVAICLPCPLPCPLPYTLPVRSLPFLVHTPPGRPLLGAPRPRRNWPALTSPALAPGSIRFVSFFEFLGHFAISLVCPNPRPGNPSALDPPPSLPPSPHQVRQLLRVSRRSRPVHPMHILVLRRLQPVLPLPGNFLDACFASRGVWGRAGEDRGKGDSIF